MLVKITQITIQNCDLKFDSLEKMKEFKKRLSDEFKVPMSDICFNMEETENK